MEILAPNELILTLDKLHTTELRMPFAVSVVLWLE